jgi:hypothetical protein|tara:strand:+ start:527 stop:1243 length:717 start_codon:yes stop_codon:yes gene_type:complete
MIGVVMGFVAFTVDGLIDKLNAFKYGAVTGLIDGGMSDFAVWVTFVGISGTLAGVAGGMCSYVEPLAAGSGIPEMKTYLNGVHLKGLLRLRTVVAKLGGIAFSISAGLIAGKEGPFVHGGGLVGGGLSGTYERLSQIKSLPVLPKLVTVQTDYGDCCPYIVQYTRYTRPAKGRLLPLPILILRREHYLCPYSYHKGRLLPLTVYSYQSRIYTWPERLTLCFTHPKPSARTLSGFPFQN